MARANPSSTLFDKTLGNLVGAWKNISFAGRQTDGLQLSPYLHDRECETLLAHMRDCLSGKGGEVSARLRAAELGETYLKFNDEGRRKFLILLTEEFSSDNEAIASAAQQLLIAEEPSKRQKIQAELRDLLEPPQVRLLTQFNALPQGTQFLVDMRADMVRYRPSCPRLAPLDNELRRQLSSWFDIGFLELRRITWDAPAALLEKLIAYEAVHQVSGWGDLKDRLSHDRRCFAFFHPRMPKEPLIFVWVALMPKMPETIREVLERPDEAIEPEDAKAAVFYSISNTQVGLQGVSLGNFLIKRVVDKLSKALPNLETFGTLSPIVGFRKYVVQHLPVESGITLTDTEHDALKALAPEESPPELLASGRWLDDEALSQAAQAPMMRICAHYLTQEHRVGKTAVLNSVAHFHLSNGARLARINWLSDLSENGLRQSYGLMVNYIYKREEIELNHEQYVTRGEVSCDAEVTALLSKS